MKQYHNIFLLYLSVFLTFHICFVYDEEYMENRYNLYNFEALFKNYLINTDLNKVSIKNYLSDIRHFSGWFTSVKRLPQNTSTDINVDDSVLNQINNSDIELYRAQMVQNNIPIKTINRRLSTLRKFFAFCIEANLTINNPLEGISNTPLSFYERASLLSDFESYLITKQIDANKVDIYIKEVENILEYL